MVFNEQTQTFISQLTTHAGQGYFDISKYVTLLTLDIICGNENSTFVSTNIVVCHWLLNRRTNNFVADSTMGKPVHAQSTKDSDYVKAVYG